MTATATSPRLLGPSSAHSSSAAMAPVRTHHVQSPNRPCPTPAAKSPTPNYFNFNVDAHSAYHLNDSPRHAKGNWSPPSSTVRSTAAASPSVIPLDQNPEFDAFRKHSQGKSFSLGGLNTFNMGLPNGGSGHGGGSSGRTPAPQETPKTATEPNDVPHNSHRSFLDPSTAELSRSPKRLLSPGAVAESHRRGSPASFTKIDLDRDTDRVTHNSSVPLEPQARFKLPLDGPAGPYSTPRRAETVPVGPESDSGDMVTPQYIVNLIESKAEEILLLDLRVSTQYAAAHLIGALNLCIPTTLLKRPSFNVQKLADTFKDDEQKRRFENWRNSSYIIVYDASSGHMKDALTCMNTIKKFRSEGYDGTLHIIRGGFADFSRSFPAYVGSGLETSSSGASTPGEAPQILPVLGGCPMPETNQPANPFFGNIRQNMDLIGGVGQIPLKRPTGASKGIEEDFPQWLREASDEPDQGKRISNKFEQIEKREKKRMEEALSGKVAWGTPKQEMGGSVQIAGLEKGNKNRYNNIWPFEHSRVKLQGVPSHGCDYFNASFIKASRSDKRYISTQAPIPATFNDFWNIIWQQDVRVIVMLTAEKEGAQVKAHNYWNEKQYGPLQLGFLSEKRASLDLDRIHRHQKRPSAMKRTSTTLSTSQLPLAQLDSKEEKNSEQPYVVVRKFTLSHSRYPFEQMREITQLQYSSWPDFGAPAHPAHLLGLVEQCNAVVRSEPPNKRPVVVHCSAGCGRTGTFCTVDSVIDMLKRQRAARRPRSSTGGSSTAMDIDGDTPTAKKKTHPPPRPPQQQQRGASDFFSSQTHHTDDNPDDGAWLQDDRQDLVEKTVEDFRHQRISMVQSLRQFVLCYESVMEWLADQGNSHMQ